MGRNGVSKRRRKLGEIVAERIVAEIIGRGWQVGEVLGTEADFMDMFRISRATFREAARQLEWQGAAGMRRGANGGLCVTAPPRHAIVFSLKTYFELSQVTREERRSTTEILAKAPRMWPESGANEAIALFGEALDDRTVAQLAESRLATATPKLSELVALRLVEDIERAGVVKGTFLGNEAHLQRRYKVSRAVLREALRRLELHDVIRVKTGAQGGIMIHHCDPDYTVELTTNYLSYARIRQSHLWEAQSSLEAAAVAEFAAAPNEDDIRQLRRALARLEDASAGNYLTAASEFHRTILLGSRNRTSALCVEVLQRYASKTRPKPDAEYLPPLKQKHRELLEMIEGRRVDEAKALLHSLFDQSRRWINQLEREQNASA